MLIDLHCHTQPLSSCSALAPEEYIDLSRERGLDGVCFTEHDRFWPESDLASLAKRTEFPVFSAVELTTDGGHVLAFGLTGREAGQFATLASLREALARAGAVAYLAHPARDGLLRVDRASVETFAGVEAANGSDSRLQNLAAAGLAHGFLLPGIGGSDAHTADEVGSAATEFTEDITDAAALAAALHSGKYRAVSLR